jgi:hypothetical protein
LQARSPPLLQPQQSTLAASKEAFLFTLRIKVFWFFFSKKNCFLSQLTGLNTFPKQAGACNLFRAPPEEIAVSTAMVAR